MKQVYIYCLKDQENNIRYIGKTINLKSRLYNHIREAKLSNGQRYVLNWIKSLLNKNQIPILEIIEICNEDNWQEKEIYWINHYKSIIPNLCNNAEGGLGGTGVKNFSKEELEKRKLRAIETFTKCNSKFNEEEKQKIWKLIAKGKKFLEIQKEYKNLSKQIYFGVKYGRQWNHISKLQKGHSPGKKVKYKGYVRIKGLFKIFDKKNILIMSSKNEKDIIEYINKNK